MSTTVRLREVGSTYGGLTGKTKADFGRGDAQFVTFLEVIQSTRLVGRSLEQVQVKEGERQNIVKRGDVLFNGSSEIPEEVALSAVVDFDPKISTFLNSFCFGFRLRPDATVDPTYLAYFFRSSAGRSLVSSLAQGATRYNIAKTKFLDVELALPSIERQREIVEWLNDADDLIATLERLIAKKQAIKQGIMQQLLTGRTRLPGFSSDWDLTKLGTVASMNSGGTPASSVAKHYGGGIPWVSISDMTRSGKYIAKTEKTLTEEGLASSAARLYEPDVVLYAMYASLGECSLAVGRVASSQAILGIETGPRLFPEFLYYWLQYLKPKVRLLGQQGTQANLNAGMVRDFVLKLPQVEEQKAIATALADADAEVSSLMRRLEKARAIKTGMMQQLLTGCTRLPAEAVS
ncbi:restriction endonuclease subunit S [Corynebacterium dentalis]|uniref:restriction endonuclease subunit S n=1 Tax=Corynebacterium dentalis TaxID=2014528 RepID=UPI00370D1D99